ncbi:MAG TPA: SDR family oxidoreductase [Solirubrobacteraceae bacterium]
MARVVLITGCSSPQGIGFSSVRALAQAGFKVHATVRDRSHVSALRDGLEDLVDVHDLDLLDEASMRTTVDAVVTADGRLDVLVNNAGYGLIGGVEQVRVEQSRANFEANFFGTVALIQFVLPVMRRHHGGHIVNVSTIFAAGLSPPAIGFYIATKAALEAVSQSLAIEAAPWEIRVTNFQPGPVMTELSREWGDRLSAGEDPRPTLSDELYDWIARGDAPAPQSPAEVAEALCAIIRSRSPGLAAQSGQAAQAYVDAALRDHARAAELAALLAEFGTGERSVS